MLVTASEFEAVLEFFDKELTRTILNRKIISQHCVSFLSLSTARYSRVSSERKRQHAKS